MFKVTGVAPGVYDLTDENGIVERVTGAATAEQAIELYHEARNPPPRRPLALDVKDEAQRRIIATTGAQDLQSCMIKQLNANMRANELNDARISGGTLTPAEEAQADYLRGLAARIKDIRTRSNEIEAMAPIPDDYAKDGYWS